MVVPTTVSEGRDIVLTPAPPDAGWIVMEDVDKTEEFVEAVALSCRLIRLPSTATVMF